VGAPRDNCGSTPLSEPRGGFLRYAIRGKVGHIKRKQKKLIARREERREQIGAEDNVQY
jgi:hypothetical protein